MHMSYNFIRVKICQENAISRQPGVLGCRNDKLHHHYTTLLYWDAAHYSCVFSSVLRAISSSMATPVVIIRSYTRGWHTTWVSRNCSLAFMDATSAVICRTRPSFLAISSARMARHRASWAAHFSARVLQRVDATRYRATPNSRDSTLNFCCCANVILCNVLNFGVCRALYKDFH